MTRLEQLRHYRMLLQNDSQRLVEKFIADGETVEAGKVLSASIDRLHERQRLLDSEIDKLMAIELGRKDAQPNVSEEFQLAHA
jgi:hypothetical protein